ncbi:MAG: sulfotransferase domain-containing protein [Planctomycetaceae bacterium]
MILSAVRHLKRFVAAHTGVQRIRELLEEQRQALERLESRQQAADAMRQALAPFAAARFPVFLDESLRPMAMPYRGACPQRVVVCSIPKSGTYLVGRLLELLGLTSTMLHVWSEGLSDYRNKTIEQMQRDYLQFNVQIPLAQSLELVRFGQFTVGHLECNATTRRLLGPFRKLFVHRNLRDALVSWMRFYMATGRAGGADDAWKNLPDGPERMLAFLELLGPTFMSLCHVDWLAAPGVLAVSFETLYGDSGASAQRAAICDVHRFLEIPTPLGDPSDIVRDLIGRPTLTWSGSRSRRDAYWSDAVERRFCALGAADVNVRLGYDEPATSTDRPNLQKAA